eukprot:159466-Rhodomonas_salina.1
MRVQSWPAIQVRQGYCLCVYGTTGACPSQPSHAWRLFALRGRTASVTLQALRALLKQTLTLQTRSAEPSVITFQSCPGV